MAIDTDVDKNTRRTFIRKASGIALLASSGTSMRSFAAAETRLKATGTLTTAELPASLSDSRSNGPAGENQARRLRLINVHTAEKLSVVYWNNGAYIQDSLDKINFVLRDFRANEVMQIDPAVLDYLYSVYSRMDTDRHIQILSGYRSPETNAMLRKRSSGVAKYSLHIIGKAIDFKIPGKPTRSLQQTALKLKIGGVGYYKKADFVHIDSGPHRSWS